MDEIQPEVPEEDFLQERGRSPLGLAGVFGNLAGFGLGRGAMGSWD